MVKSYFPGIYCLSCTPVNIYFPMIISYPDTLPVSHHRQDIIEALRTNQIIIVAGDTGSGKTTQIPKMCLEVIAGGQGKIGCTQPRRIAAQTVAERVQEELGELYPVGYKIRFRDRTDRHTKIKFMTDGVLLAESRQDKYLNEYDILMIDEAHERSLNIDFLLGHLKNILRHRPDLKIIITSATIDTQAFSTHFEDAPIISIAGTTYPVEVRYEPPQSDEYGESTSYLEGCINMAAKVLENEPPGDMLVFLPTERDIRTCAELLLKKLHNVDILPLFGRMQSADQKKIFLPSSRTKVVIATNVAETSITVPGIRYVIDSGLARISYYNYRAKTNSLPIQKISQASCNQRKGRCGRMGPGVCIRLYEEADFLEREEFSIPEIKRSNLAEVILQMTTYKLGDPYSFPFLDPPQKTAINEGYRQLYELGAINDAKKLTKMGRIMASMPIDPCISRIILEANHNNCLREVVIIATVLAIQDPRVRPANHEKQADEAHKRFQHPHSDFLSFFNIWENFHNIHEKTSWSRLKKYCKANFLSFQRMREWIDLHDQMIRIIRTHQQFSFNSQPATYEDIHKSLTVGFLRNIAQRKKDKLYQGSSAKELMIFPGSSQFTKNPQWLLAASFLETSRLYALHVAAIQPEWLEPLAKKLCRYSWSNPRYLQKTGLVMADEQVALFGLIIIASRKVNYGQTNKSNMKEARKIFIQSALIEGQLTGSFGFYRYNLQLTEKWENVEDRLRTRDILVSEDMIFQFYDNRLLDNVYDRPTLEKFLRKKRSADSSLRMKEEDVVSRAVGGHELVDYPSEIHIGSHTFPLSYVFDPADERDGVTVRIPFDIAQTLTEEQFEWLVPGLLREKTTSLLKGLPKSLRKQLVPLNHSVDAILDDIEPYRGSYYAALARSIAKLFNFTIKKSDWSKRLPQHLSMRFVLFDVTGKDIASGRDLKKLIQQHHQTPGTSTINAGKREQEIIASWEKLVTRQWAFSDLPITVPLITKNNEIGGYLYPAIKPLAEQNAVTIKFSSKLEEVKEQTRSGLRLLYRLQFTKPYNSLKKMCSTTLSGPSSFWLVEIFSTKKETVDALLNFTIDTLFENYSGEIPSADEFTKKVAKVSDGGFFPEGKKICDQVMAVLRQRRDVVEEILRLEKLAKQIKSHMPQRYQEYRNLLDDILPHDFLDTFIYTELEDRQRYMKGLILRMTRAHADFQKDQKKSRALQPHFNNLQTLKKRFQKGFQDCLEKEKEYEMLIQEYRISLFSPELKTKVAVSEKRLAKAWQKIEENC